MKPLSVVGASSSTHVDGCLSVTLISWTRPGDGLGTRSSFKVFFWRSWSLPVFPSNIVLSRLCSDFGSSRDTGMGTRRTLCSRTQSVTLEY